MGAGDFELVGGACVPIGRGHAGERVVLVVVEVAFFIHESIANMNGVHDADDEAVIPDFKSGVAGAFEGDGGLNNTGDGDFFGGGGGEFVLGELIGAVGEGGGGGDHDLAEGLINHVDHEVAGFADVTGGIFRGVTVFITGGEGYDGGIGAKDVEERKWRGIGPPIPVAAGDPGDGAGGD